MAERGIPKIRLSLSMAELATIEGALAAANGRIAVWVSVQERYETGEDLTAAKEQMQRLDRAQAALDKAKARFFPRKDPS